MTRPEITIDWNRVNQLLEYGCTGTEVASSLGIHPDTLYFRVKDKYNLGFSDYAAKKKASGASIIREHQFLKAIGQNKKGDNTMLIWLGKQLCNQKETNSEALAPEEIQKRYDEVMKQLKGIQEGSESLVEESDNFSSNATTFCDNAVVNNSITQSCSDLPSE